MNALPHSSHPRSLKPKRIGLTGGIGSGKSTVAQILVQSGAHLIDADAISRASTAPNGAAMAAIAQTFGPDMIDAQGALNRARMRALVFKEPKAKQQLEAIVHPLIAQEIERQYQACTTPWCVSDIPLLVESARWRTVLDTVWVVDCSQATQIQRVQTRDGLAPELIHNIMQNQASRAQRLSAADAVIYNENKTKNDLQQELQKWLRFLV